MYAENVPEDVRGANGVKSCQLAAEWIASPTKYSIANLKKVNSKSDDFAASYEPRQILQCPHLHSHHANKYRKRPG